MRTKEQEREIFKYILKITEDYNQKIEEENFQLLYYGI